MLPAFIYGLVNALSTHAVLAICYLITILALIKSNIISKADSRRLIKRLAIMHAIYFIPIALLGMFILLEHYFFAIIWAIILTVLIFPINISLTYKKQKRSKK